MTKDIDALVAAADALAEANEASWAHDGEPTLADIARILDALTEYRAARGPKRIAHPYKGPDLPTEVFADPGRNGWYFREKKPDSVARFVRDETRIRSALEPCDPLSDPRVVALRGCASMVFLHMSSRDGVCTIPLWVADDLRAALAALSPTGGKDE